jgi:hypothetical protein
MIDLGKKRESIEMVMEESPAKDKSSYYPGLYLNDIPGLKDAPDVGTEGTAKIKYRVVSKNESERENQDGEVKESYALDIDVMGIEFDSAKENSTGEDEIEDGLSESEKEVEKEKEKETETEKED